MTQQPVQLRNGVAIMDPNNSTTAIPNTLKINADGSINVEASGATFSAGAVATVAAPTYVEGTTDALSQSLVGSLRVTNTTAIPAGSNVIGHVIVDTTSTTAVTQATGTNLHAVVDSSTPVKSTTFTASQVTVPATTNGIILLALNANRLGATISNPGSVPVYISAASTGLTVSNGFAIPPGASYNIDAPLYTGALYGIISTSTTVVTIVELT